MSAAEPPKCPPVVFWYKIYLVVNVLMYLAASVIIPAFLYYRGESIGLDDLLAKVYAVMGFLVLVPLGLCHVVPFFMKARPAAWMYGWFIIVLGLTGCLFPANIVLMIYWARADVKRYFGKVD